jgi:ribosomal protein S18 acetylase RimI-like enzyme
MDDQAGPEPLRTELLDTATITLARAFQDDPMFRWVFPDPARRRRDLGLLNRVLLQYGLRYGCADHSNDGSAVALWIPPGQKMTTARLARSGNLLLPMRIGVGRLRALLTASSAMDRIHKRCAPVPHWYLVVLGIEPQLQGKGRGSSLLRHGLARADRTGAPCYLETSQRSNLDFYERHGFSVVGQAPIGQGAPTAWAMLRDPA